MKLFGRSQNTNVNPYEKLIIRKFRALSKTNATSTSIKISDADIMYVYNTVETSFKLLSRICNNELPIGIINYLVLFHLSFYEKEGDNSFKMHLRLELEKGLNSSFTIQQKYQEIQIL